MSVGHHSRRLPGDTATPVALARRCLARGEEAFLLESVEGGERVSRYSFLGARPRARVTLRGRRATIEEGGAVRSVEADPLALLQELAVRPGYRRPDDAPPFSAGAVGYLSYDCIRLWERIPDRHRSEDDLPDAVFLIFDGTIAFDHARGEIVLQAVGGEADARARLDEMEEMLRSEAPAVESAPSAGSPETFAERTSRESFLEAVARSREHIAAGDIYQIQISRRWEADLASPPFAVYRALRRINPSPYHFYLGMREATILGASPEMLVRVRGRCAETRPLAGTYPRGGTSEEDAALAARLLADPKERAEHVMLVDLARNDLGRVCEPGSVRVTDFFSVEKYSHVQHLVTGVVGRLAPGRTSLDALAAAFPAGTLTGAPKIRAMELIDELETLRRGVYGGAVAYLDAAGDLDSCIAIRTMVVRGRRARVQAAAGIVADSVPEREARETEIKADALFRAAREAGSFA